MSQAVRDPSEKNAAADGSTGGGKDRPERTSKVALGLSALSLLVSLVQAYPQAKAFFFPTATCADPRGLTPLHGLTATATSTLPAEGANTYVPDNAVDWNDTTAWAPAGGNGGSGQQLFIHLASPEDVRLACVVNGYAKDSDLYLRNARMHDVSVQTDAGTAAGALKDLPPDESREYQDLPLPKGRTTLVSITVTSNYSGIYNNGLSAHLDLCVSEVELYRR